MTERTVPVEECIRQDASAAPANWTAYTIPASQEMRRFRDAMESGRPFDARAAAERLCPLVELMREHAIKACEDRLDPNAPPAPYPFVVDSEVED